MNQTNEDSQGIEKQASGKERNQASQTAANNADSGTREGVVEESEDGYFIESGSYS